MKPTAQWVRHTVQALVFAWILVSPFLAWYATRLSRGEMDLVLDQESAGAAHSMVTMTHGLVAGTVDETDPALRVEAMRHRAQWAQGNTWAGEIVGWATIDPLAGAEAMATGSGHVPTILLALLLPVALTVVLGRVFCSWVCPAGFVFETADHVRRRLGIRARERRLPDITRYVLLGVGLVVAAATALPVLGYTYPPALVVRETHGLVTGFLDRNFGLASAPELLPWTAASLFVFAILAAEIVFSRRMWCRYLCPGGALYSLLGRFRVVRVRLRAAACTDCAQCAPACGMGLNPMQDQMGAACDTCMECVTSCPDGALMLKLRAPDRD